MSIESPTPPTYSEEWWRVALSSIGDGVIVTDMSGRIDFMNPVAEALTNWAGADAKGKAIGEIFPIINESTRNPVENPVHQVIESGTGAELANHTVLLAKNGSQIFIDDSAAPIRGTDGRVFGVVLVFRDTSEKKLAQVAQLRLASIIDSSQDAVLSESMEGVILTLNRGAEAIYGYTAAEIVGQSSSVLVPRERAEENSVIQGRIRRGGADRTLRDCAPKKRWNAHSGLPCGFTDSRRRATHHWRFEGRARRHGNKNCRATAGLLGRNS